MKAQFKATILILLLSLLLFTIPAFAKDLENKIGAGFASSLSYGFLGSADDNLTNSIIATNDLSIKYWFTNYVGIQGQFGYFTAKNGPVGGWAADIAVRGLFNIILEEQMNLYAGLGLGILPAHVDYGQHGVSDMNEVGFQASGFGGVEFFFSGLPNLGFNLEIGLKYIDIDKFKALSTYGGPFATVGFHYYF